MDLFGSNKTNQQKLDDAFDREWKFLEQAGKVSNFPIEEIALQDDNICLCGLPLDNAGPDCYSHMTKGY